MDGDKPGRVPFDVAAYERAVRAGPCFICALVAGDLAPSPTSTMMR